MVQTSTRSRFLVLLAAAASLAWMGPTTAEPTAPRTLDKSVARPTLSYPSANAVFDERTTPAVPLRAELSDPQANGVTVTFYACEAAGLSCSEPGRVIASVTTPPYQFDWAPQRRLASGALEVRYLVWVGAQNSLGEERLSDPTPVVLLQPPPLPSVRLVAPGSASGMVAPAAPVLYATAVPGATTPPSSIARVDFLDGSNVIGSLTTPNAAPSGYALTWPNPSIGAHQVRVSATDSLGDRAISDLATIYVVPGGSPPRVTLTAPQSGQTVAPDAPLMLSATAVSDLGRVQRVEFAAGGTIVGTAFSSPYAVVWQNPPPGKYAVVARAYDDLGIAAASSAAYVEVPIDRRLPAVVMAQPPAGATVTASAPLTLAAIALGVDAPISRVDFLAGAAVVGSVVAPPYAYTWTPQSAGALLLSARAYDAHGASATSAAVNVSVATGPTTTIRLIAPESGAAFGAPATIELRAATTLPADRIASVEYSANGIVIGSVRTPPYILQWRNVGAGPYALVARAIDSSGVTTSSSPVPITVTPAASQAPQVALIAPVPNQVLAAGSSIRVTAEASTPNGRIVSVEFLDGATVFGSVTSPPYATLWEGAQFGNHQLSARVTDDRGMTATSVPIPVQVEPVGIALDSGIDGISVADDHLLLAGSVRAPRNAALLLDGREVPIDSQGRFLLDVVDLALGRNALTLTLNTLDGAPIRRSLAIDSQGTPGFRVALEPGHGYAPFSTKLAISMRADISFGHISVDSNGDGIADVTLTELPGGTASLDLTMPNAGTYPVSVTVYDSKGATMFRTTRTVRVFERGELGLKVVDAYQTMVGRLAAENVAGALRAFVGDMQDRYADVFEALAVSPRQVAEQLGQLVDGVVSENSAELTIARDTPNGKELFMVYLIRGGDGIWRIESM
jgi:hypothetical protein